MKSIGKWLGRYYLAIIFSLIFFLYAFFRDYPVHFSTFVLHRNLLGLGEIFTGWAVLPVNMIFIPIRGISRPIALFMYPIIYPLSGFLYGLLIQYFWRKGKSSRSVAIIILLMNSAMGLYNASWNGTFLSYDKQESCEKFLAPDEGLRIIWYRTIGDDGFNINIFFLASADGGKTWNQISAALLDESDHPICSTITEHDENYSWQSYFEETWSLKKPGK